MSRTEPSQQPNAPELDKIVPDNAPEPPQNVILRHEAWAKMWAEDNNVLFTCVGDTGDGKSMAALRIGEVLDPNFSIDNVAFDIVEFLKLVMDDSFGQGSVIVLEEASIEASAMEWHSVSNKVFRQVLDTWRHQNRMAIITLPSFKALDKGARRRTSAIVEMEEAKAWKGYSQAKFKRAEYNNIDDNFTSPFPHLEGMKRKWIRFNLPSEELREEYETAKEDYTEGLNEDLLEELLEERGETEDGETKLDDPKDIGDDILDGDTVPDEYIKVVNGGQRFIDTDAIELDYDIGARKSKKVKSYLLRESDADVM